MKKINDLSVYKRLIYSFGLIGIIIIIISIISVQILKSISSQLNNFYNVSFNISTVSNDLSKLIIDTENTLYRALTTLDDDKVNQYVESVNKNVEQIYILFNTLKETIKGDEISVDMMSSKYDEVKTLRNEVIELISQNRHNEAATIINADYQKLNDEIIEQLKLLSNSSSEKAQEFIDASNTKTNMFKIFLIFLVILTIILLLLLSALITKSIVKPLSEIKLAVMELSNGNLDIKLNYTGKDEFGQLADSTRESICELKKYIDNISNVLQKLSNKNIDISIDIDYKGNFKPIKESMNIIIKSFDSMIKEIKGIATQVTNGSDKLACISESLSVGTTQQSSSIQDLLSTINQVTQHIIVNAENAENVNSLSLNSKAQIDKGVQFMESLLNSMNDITNCSQEISKIIELIGGISRQTNLLSLNASIEAARAGEHGAGFTVVAKEIGNLANECSEATKNITKLIKNTISVVEEGSKLATETSDVLGTVVKSSTQINELVEDISKACAKQSQSLEEISEGVEQISMVVNNNSATAQQTSASSQELLAQSETLVQMLSLYKLKKVVIY